MAESGGLAYRSHRPTETHRHLDEPGSPADCQPRTHRHQRAFRRPAEQQDVQRQRTAQHQGISRPDQCHQTDEDRGGDRAPPSAVLHPADERSGGGHGQHGGPQVRHNLRPVEQSHPSGREQERRHRHPQAQRRDPQEEAPDECDRRQGGQGQADHPDGSSGQRDGRDQERDATGARGGERDRVDPRRHLREVGGLIPRRSPVRGEQQELCNQVGRPHGQEQAAGHPHVSGPRAAGHPHHHARSAWGGNPNLAPPSVE